MKVLIHRRRRDLAHVAEQEMAWINRWAPSVGHNRPHGASGGVAGGIGASWRWGGPGRPVRHDGAAGMGEGYVKVGPVARTAGSIRLDRHRRLLGALRV